MSIWLFDNGVHCLCGGCCCTIVGYDCDSVEYLGGYNCDDAVEWTGASDCGTVR